MSRRRRLLTLLLAAWSVALATGLPLPSLPKVAETAERFPCEECPCGCATAEYCWNHCCCHSVEQRIAWARREGVRPPTKVLVQAAAAGVDVSEWDASLIAVKTIEKGSCCSTEPACCSTKASCCSVKNSCCGAKAPSPPVIDNIASPKKGRGISAPHVLLVKALACHGLLETWLAIGAAPVPEHVVMPEFADFGAAPVLLLPILCSVVFPPDTPPPEDGVGGIS